MFSVIFPGQGSQVIGLGKDFFDKYNIVKELFLEADDALGISLSKIIMDGPKEELDLTVNTQPAIFLISYSIFQVVKKEFNINLNEAKFFAGHSLGEYSALSAANYLNFSETIKLLKVRGEAMQNAVPNGEGGMLAVLGSTIEILEQIIIENKNGSVIKHDIKMLSKLDRSTIVEILLNSGAWPFIKQRPYGILADPDIIPKSIASITKHPLHLLFAQARLLSLRH